MRHTVWSSGALRASAASSVIGATKGKVSSPVSASVPVRVAAITRGVRPATANVALGIMWLREKNAPKPVSFT